MFLESESWQVTEGTRTTSFLTMTAQKNFRVSIKVSGGRHKDYTPLNLDRRGTAKANVARCSKTMKASNILHSIKLKIITPSQSWLFLLWYVNQISTFEEIVISKVS